mgnify:CR=1 FL=1
MDINSFRTWCKISSWFDEDDLDRSEFFYLPGKVLHIDGDSEYLTRCLNYYKKHNVLAIGKKIMEVDIASKIRGLLEEFKPDF